MFKIAILCSALLTGCIAITVFWLVTTIEWSKHDGDVIMVLTAIGVLTISLMAIALRATYRLQCAAVTAVQRTPSQSGQQTTARKDSHWSDRLRVEPSPELN
jgi:hypothetical protein